MNSKRMAGGVVVAAVLLACAAVVPALAAGPAGTTPDILKRGSQWMSLRAGYAKATGEFSADGMMGLGFGYRRFVLSQWSFGAFVHYDVLGRFDKAADIDVPLTLEVVRHTHWGSAFYPYLGIGAGAFYRKYSRTGEDTGGFSPGRFITIGAQTPIQPHGLLGLDIRMASVNRPDANPSFSGPSASRPKVDDWFAELLREQVPGNVGQFVMISNDASKTQTLWSIKIDYTITY